MKELQVRNRQRARTIDTRLLRAITVSLLEEILALSEWQLAVHLLSARAMAKLNEQFLQHHGPTDVITFDLRETVNEPGTGIEGEIFVCPEVALRQAVEFRTSWQEEVVRYVSHGVLHLLGYDDLVPGKRARMKREENRLVRKLVRRFDVTRLAP